MTENAGPDAQVRTTNLRGIDDRPFHERLRDRPLLTTRIVWAPPLLIATWWLAIRRYNSDLELVAFYATAAQVIVTLYIAIVIDLIGTSAAGERRALTNEHWVFLLFSSAGLLGSLRGLVESSGMLFGMSVAGVAATVLLVAESLIYHHESGTWRAPFWSLLSISALAILVLWP